MKIFPGLSKVLNEKLEGWEGAVHGRGPYTAEFWKASSAADGYFSFRIAELNGCCGIAMADSLRANLKDYETAIKFMESVAFRAGYSRVMYTTIKTQSHILNHFKANEYQPIHTFNSQRTGNDITVWVKDILKGAKDGVQYAQVGTAEQTGNPQCTAPQV